MCTYTYLHIHSHINTYMYILQRTYGVTLMFSTNRFVQQHTLKTCLFCNNEKAANASIRLVGFPRNEYFINLSRRKAPLADYVVRPLVCWLGERLSLLRALVLVLTLTTSMLSRKSVNLPL